MRKTIHITVSGRVQGVCYRAATQSTARRLGLCGTVRNLADGRVEIIAHGDSEALEQLVAWCWQGPPAARVTEVCVADSDAATLPADFLIVHD